MGWSLSGCQPTRPSVVGMCEDGLCKIKPMLELFTFIYHKGPTLLGYIFRVVKITRIPSQNNVTHRLVAYIQSMNERWHFTPMVILARYHPGIQTTQSAYSYSMKSSQAKIFEKWGPLGCRIFVIQVDRLSIQWSLKLRQSWTLTTSKYVGTIYEYVEFFYEIGYCHNHISSNPQKSSVQNLACCARYLWDCGINCRHFVCKNNHCLVLHWGGTGIWYHLPFFSS